MTRPDTARPHAAAERHLARATPVFARLIREIGPCTLRPDADRLAVMVRMVIAQLISTKAAKSIAEKLFALAGEPGLTAARLAELTDAQLRGCGLSSIKQKFLRALQAKLLEEPGFFGRVDALPDREMEAELRGIPGVGPWTVEMYRIFAMGNPDVLAVGDLGLRLGAKEQFDLPGAPDARVLVQLAEPWRPYRTAATWYLWRSRGFVPQSGGE